MWVSVALRITSLRIAAAMDGQAVITLLVFGLLVPWAARKAKRAAGWGLGLAIVAAVLIPMTFWSGVPLIAAAAAAVLGTTARRLGGGGLARAATVIGIIAMVGPVSWPRHLTGHAASAHDVRDGVGLLAPSG